MCSSDLGDVQQRNAGELLDFRRMPVHGVGTDRDAVRPGGLECGTGLAQQAGGGVPLAGLLQRGDFVFFNTLGGAYSHMGIYVGNGQFVHAPSSGGTVQRVRMDNVYFAKRFTEARSIFV